MIRVLNIKRERFVKDIRLSKFMLESIISDTIIACVSELIRDRTIVRAIINSIDVEKAFDEIVDDVREEAFSFVSIAWWKTYYDIGYKVSEEIKKDYDWLLGVNKDD